jgi:hypothetical protein
MNPMPTTTLISLYWISRQVQFGLDAATCRWYREWLIAQQVHWINRMDGIEKYEFKINPDNPVNPV